MTSAAASLPGPVGDLVGAGLPDPDRLRAALRPAELPLPFPRGVREAAGRVNDLLHAERHEEALALAERFRDVPAEAVDRLALLRAAFHAAVLAGDDERSARDAADMVAQLRRSGASEQAEAVVTVLLERGPFGVVGAGGLRAAHAEEDPPSPGTPQSAAAPARPGRRRGRPVQASPAMLVVTRALERSAVVGPRGAVPDPRRDAARLRAALAALPELRDRLLVDPEQELRLRLAQSLEGLGDEAGATTAALDVLDLITDRAVDLADPGTDPERLATSAHAVLARTLGVRRPLDAVHHALEALEVMHEIEDPPLRIGLITSLLQALMAAGARSEAGFTAGRLLSLQRTLDQDRLRIAPLLAVAAQRLQSERLDAAAVPLEQARTIARELRDRRALMEVARLAASLHERTGDHSASLRELRGMAEQARWLADDLATPTSAQGELIRAELQANALAMRRALDLGRRGAVESAVQAIERRTRRDGGRPVLPPELLWDHRVDARVGRFLAVADALVRGGEGADDAACRKSLGEARQTIEERPEGHDARAQYWRAYLEDRHAHLLAERGQREAALEAARRAREGWRILDSDEDLARVDELLAALAAEPARDPAPRS